MYTTVNILFFCEKRKKKTRLTSLFLTGRNDQIWTDDPFHPKEVRYQAALRPDDVRLLYTLYK